MNDHLKKLLDIVSGTDKVELVTLYNGVISGMKAYQTASTAANKRDWDAAKNGLQETVDRLWPVYFPEQSVAEPERFEQQTAARTYLIDKGYKVSTGKFSTDWNNGKLRVQRDGSVHRVDLLEYAATLDVDRKKISSFEQLERRKAELAVQRLEQQVKKGELENRKADRNWIARETVFEREGALVGQIMGDARYQIGRAVPAVIHAAKGDTSRTPEIKKILEEALFEAFRTIYESGEVDQTFLDEEED